MDKIILTCLIVMTLEQALGLAYNFSTRARNEKNTRIELDRLYVAFNKLETRLQEQVQYNQNIQKINLDTGFVITDRGIKLLPAGWEAKMAELVEGK